MTQTKPCPKCKNGTLRIIKNKFWGCSNYYKTGCKHTEKYFYQKEVIQHTPTNWLSFTPSEYQQPIKQQFGNGCNFRVNATAGSGKSKTIEYVAYDITASILVLAFNTDIAGVLQQKLPNAIVKTVSAWGFSMIKSYLNTNYIKMVENKVFLYLKNAHMSDDLSEIERKQTYKMIFAADNLVKKVQSFGIKNPDNDDLSYLVLESGMRIKDHILPIVFTWVLDALQFTRNLDLVKKYGVSYGDMLDIPYYHEMVDQAYDYIFIDESQDLNSAQLEMIYNTANINTRVMFVGDENQAIYGWRGAGSESMQDIGKLFETVDYPLPLTYRNPKSHCRLVNELLPYIQHIPLDNAPEGILERIDYTQFYNLVKPGNMVISRANFTSVKHALALLKKGVAVNILGKDIGYDLVNILKDHSEENDHVDSVIASLEDWKISQTSRLDKIGKFSQSEQIKDKIDTLIELLLEYDNVSKAISFLEKVFTHKENKNAITFSTIHKAKGMENDTVFVLDFNKLVIGNEHNGDQELNVTFVAITRSKNAMYLVSEPEQQ